MITGGGSGVVQVHSIIARLFIQHHAKVLIVNIQDELGRCLYMKNLAPKIQHLTFLVTRDSEVQNVADLAVSMNAKLDVIYNNADVSSDVDPRILSTTGDEFKRVVDVNLFGAFSELNMQPG